MLCIPTPRFEMTGDIAEPAASATGAPRAMGPLPVSSKKVTVPVGAGFPAVPGATVAVNVSPTPTVEFMLGLTVRVVVVVSGVTVSVKAGDVLVLNVESPL